MWQHTVAQDTLCNCAALASVMEVLCRAQDDWVDDGPMDRWTDGPPATCSERRGHGACSATALDIIRETSTGAVEPAAVPWSGETAIFLGSILGINTRITI